MRSGGAGCSLGDAHRPAAPAAARAPQHRGEGGCWPALHGSAVQARAVSDTLGSPGQAAAASLYPQANGLGHVARAAQLEWGGDVSLLQPPYDLVLASDVLYLADSLPAFVQTLAALSDARTRTLLCNEHRAALPFPLALFEGAGFAVREVPLCEHHPEWRSDDIQLFDIRLAQ